MLLIIYIQYIINYDNIIKIKLKNYTINKENKKK